MPIFDHTTFEPSGLKHIPNLNFVAPTIDEKIAELERRICSKMFGAMFYETLLSEHIAGFPTQRWANLWNGVGAWSKDDYYEGFTGFSYFLFFHVLREQLTSVTDGTVTIQFRENSKTVQANKRLFPAWNEGVYWYNRAENWILHSNDFPEFSPQQNNPEPANPWGF